MKDKKIGPTRAALIFTLGLVALFLYCLYFLGLCNGEAMRAFYGLLANSPGGSSEYITISIVASGIIGIMMIIRAINDNLSDILYSFGFLVFAIAFGWILSPIAWFFGSLFVLAFFSGTIYDLFRKE